MKKCLTGNWINRLSGTPVRNVANEHYRFEPFPVTTYTMTREEIESYLEQKYGKRRADTASGH